MLSIIIPTYNRAKLISGLLEELLNQIPSWAELIVLDNASDDFEIITERFKKAINKGEIRIIRNRYNVEGNENILRCVEYSNFEWIWILGDDDIITKDCFNTIWDDLLKFNDTGVFMIHYNWNKIRYSNTSEIYTFSQLFENTHSIGDINFISSNLLRKEKIIPFLGNLHFYQLSATPTLSMALFVIDQNFGSIILSNHRIVQNGFYRKDKDLNDRWDVQLVLKCLNILTLYPFKIENKKILTKEIQKVLSIPIAIKGSVRDYLRNKSQYQAMITFYEILSSRLIYKNIFYIIPIKLIGLALRCFIIFTPYFIKHKKNEKYL